MNDETRRRQMRETLMAKATRIIEADRKRRLENFEKISELRRNRKKPYSPERFAAEVRDLFGGKRRNAAIGK